MNSASLLLRQHRRRSYGSGGLLALRFAILLLWLPVGLGLAALAAAVGGAAAVYAAYVRELPTPEEIGRLTVETFETTRIYDRTGQTVLYELIPATGGRRTWVPLPQISEYVRNATIAMEDKTFYTNPGGINVEGLGRAVWGLARGENAGGGSSIHQQLVRNVIMTFEERMERSYTRKVKEIVLAIELDRRYPGIQGRDLILEWYLNTIFYGQSAYGIEAAAQTFFRKSASELSLAEAAMLVPLPNAPTLNPMPEHLGGRPAEAKRRQEIVLDSMARQGSITPEEAWTAKQEALTIAPPGFDLKTPHFALYARDRLVEKYGAEAVYGGGLQVITSIDLDVQERALQYARERIAALQAQHNVSNAAVVVLDTKRAEILAMVGSLDYGNKDIDGSVNMALAPRQPGSSFKPFTYATAFAQG
ncbi:MAG: transglycosylase domain-containing protein, partial [Chloroflexota bacterium]